MELDSNNTLQVFKYFRGEQESQVRTAGSFEEPLFCAKDVCSILGIENNRNATARLKPYEKVVHAMDGPGGRQEMTFITESGLYRLISASNKKEAKVFQDWIYGEVLPSIRKTGSYTLRTKIESLEQKVAEMSQRRYLITPGKETSIRLTDRLVQLGIFEEVEIARIYSTKVLVIGGKLTGVHHPDKNAFQSHIFALSKRLSKAKKINKGVFPNVRKGDRSNVYTAQDFADFGDAIIQAYLKEFGEPHQRWGIDFTWGWCESVRYTG